MIIENKGEMKLCPFRISEEIIEPMLKGQGAKKVQGFMPCIKEACNCYRRRKYDNGDIEESCYRDHVGYIRTYNINEKYSAIRKYFGVKESED